MAVYNPTSLSDLIVPEIFAPYFQVRTSEKSAVLSSGIAESSPQLASYATGAGQTFHLPFFQDLGGVDNVIQEGTNIDVENITAEQEVAVVLNRAKAWGASYLSRVTTGEDIMNRIGNLVGDWWARRHQAVLLSVLNAMFRHDAAGTGTAQWGKIRDSHLLDKSTDPFEASFIIEAMGKLGDASGQLSAMVMHSAIYHSLSKNDLIDYERDSTVGVQFPTYLGKKIIVDDACTSERANIFRTYLFNNGAIQYGQGAVPPRDAVETDRNTLGSEDILITRQRMIFHPRGFKWIGGINPDNDTSLTASTSLINPSNWTKVIEDKQVGMVAIECLAA